MVTTTVESGDVFFHRRLFRLAILLSLPLFLVALGCTPPGPAQSVTGKVTLNDKPVNGIVVFHAADGKKFNGPLGPSDGVYTVGPPPGPYKISVEGFGAILAPPSEKIPKDKSGGKTLGGTGTMGVAPPAKYADAAKSGLTYEVTTAAKQEFNIPLTP